MLSWRAVVHTHSQPLAAASLVRRAMSARRPAIEARRVTRRFGYRRVIGDISFELHGRDVLALLGPNGAGKTTLLRVLAGLLKPSSGEVVRAGLVSMVAHQSMLYDALTARENLAFFARLHGIGGRKKVDSLLDQVGLKRRSNDLVATFSRGMLQRLSFARALLGDPEILLLDEPLSSLDDAAVRIVLDILSESSAAGRTIVIVTHSIDPVLGLATKVGYLISGKLTAIEPLAGRSAAEVGQSYREAVARG